jgi:uncharacterized protein (DUF4415 family)
MSNAKMVRYTRKPLTEAQQAELNAAAEKPDDEIDLSDMPELGDEFFNTAQQGAMYKALKRQTTLRIDADVLAWFKSQSEAGKGYQTSINRVLREYVEAQRKKAG